MTPQKNVAKPTMKPPKSGITVRMYNPGFGDCLLLAFRAVDKSARYMLIDFGVHHQYPNREEKALLVAEDIAKTTGNKLHFVVATHEHTDHLYGFKYGARIFDNIDIDELWLAWTEDPNNDVARELKQRYGMRIRALTAAVDQLKLAKSPLADTLQGLLDFETSEDWLALAAGEKPTTLDYLRSRCKEKPIRSEDYRHPAEILTLPNVKGIKIYVLGPPTKPEMIGQLEKKSETYLELTDINEIAAFAAAALKAAGKGSPEDEELFKRSCPFDKALEIPKNNAKDHEFFIKHYGFSKQNGHGLEWRRIDTDWLATAEQLALDINRRTNNTSLVLAIELTSQKRRQVLLFAADAQVGNWLSWHNLWQLSRESDEEEVTAAALLRRTVLYKVGHHGSQNATLRQKGLEMMESPNLVAMIPVDEKWANKEMNWEHPSHNLLARLRVKTKGRIIRSDEIPSGDQLPMKPPEASEDEWKAFLSHLDWDRSENKLWIQYTVPR